MRRALLIAHLVTACGLAAHAFAQAPRRQTDQFYANGDGAYAWNTDSKKKLRTTTWFVKHPSTAPTYRQLTAIIYDAAPDKVIYIDKTTRRVVGQLDLNTEKFSLLPPEAQKVNQAFDTIKFPAGGQLPTVVQMFEPLTAGERGNTKKLALPPPTLQFPRLEHSIWDTSYMSADRFLIRSELTLDGDKGTYRLTQKPGTGRLSEVTHEREGDEHLIRGNWALGRSKGTFKFNVPAENLNVFWGEFSFEQGRTVGAWDGVRRPRPALKASEKRLP